VVAVICGGRGGLSKALEQTKAVAKQVDVIGLMSPAAKEFIGEDRLRSEGGIREIVTLESGMSPGELVDRADIVLVAQLTRTTLARIGLGLSDSLPSSVVLTALWDGTPVVVARDGVDPDLAARDPEKAADAPRELARLYAEYLTRVESFGCAVIAAEQIADTVLSMLTGREPRLERAMKQRRVITEEDVRRAARRGESISVARAIVTPLARDVAKEMGVELAGASGG
jgi:pyruvate/2-oxoglutarate dehydrogenase complex dihydrolipoamide acyltransferase (E2) component